MFRTLTVRGEIGTIRWAYHDAAVLRRWRITKDKDGRWTLAAGLDRADRFQLGQTPLRFVAPRPGGFWCWPVQSVTVGSEQITARLGPPEQ